MTGMAGTTGIADALPMLQSGNWMNLDVGAGQRSDDDALRIVAQQFEAIFINQLLKSMRSTTLESGLFGQDQGSKMYREMYDQALAERMSATGDMGIGKMVYDELRRTTGGSY